MFAVRAGQMEEARAAFLKSLEYDPNNATTYLWLAGVAHSEREAYKYLDQARRLNADHSQLARAAEGIHQHFARQKPHLRLNPNQLPFVPTRAPGAARCTPGRGLARRCGWRGPVHLLAAALCCGALGFPDLCHRAAHGVGEGRGCASARRVPIRRCRHGRLVPPRRIAWQPG